MSETIELQGRTWQARELEQIRQWVEQNSTWSRYRLSRELCVGWNWVRPNGQLADMAARSFLNKLHERALIQLPPSAGQSQPDEASAIGVCHGGLQSGDRRTQPVGSP